MILKWTFWMLFILSLFGLLFWLMFYSIDLANLAFVVPSRSEFQNISWKIKGVFQTSQRSYPPFEPIYTIRVTEIDKNKLYTYEFLGFLNHMDIQNLTIYLNGYDNKTYPFNIYNNFEGTDDQVYLDFTENDDKIRYPLNGVEFDSKFENSVFKIVWQDSRTLSQIYKDYSIKNIPFNGLPPNPTDLFLFAKNN